MPLTNGLVALYSAGYYSTAIELLIRLGLDKQGSWPALAFYFALDAWRKRDQSIDLGYPDWIEEADDIGAQAIEMTAKLNLDELFRQRDGGKTLERWARNSIPVADMEFEDDWEVWLIQAWAFLKPFIRQLYEKCGGEKLTEMRLIDYMPFLPSAIMAVRPLDI